MYSIVLYCIMLVACSLSIGVSQACFMGMGNVGWVWVWCDFGRSLPWSTISTCATLCWSNSHAHVVRSKIRLGQALRHVPIAEVMIRGNQYGIKSVTILTQPLIIRDIRRCTQRVLDGCRLKIGWEPKNVSRA